LTFDYKTSLLTLQNMSFYVIKAYLLHAERYAFAFIIQCELTPECYKVLITNALSYVL